MNPRHRIYAWFNNRPQLIGRAHAPTFDEACVKLVSARGLTLAHTRVLYPSAAAAKEANNVV